MFLSIFYITTCIAAIIALNQLGIPEFSYLVYGAAMLVAILGVPHGGLDHWTGRRLLQVHFGSAWWMMFFPVYLLVCMAVVALWFAVPSAAVVGFFLLSAWHFGREEQHLDRLNAREEKPSRWVAELSAISRGGLIIWIPSLARPHEMESLLGMIVPGSDSSIAEQIVSLTGWIATLLCPVAFLFFCLELREHGREIETWVPLATAAFACFTPILVSFTAYFCLWHSLLGLSRLQVQEGLPGLRFLISILPLSLLAVAGVIAFGFFLQPSVGIASIPSIPASLQTLFIGLSAIAVPHMLLHECADVASTHGKHLEVRS